MTGKITTESLREQGHAFARAWEATCPACGGKCRTHSLTGVLGFNEHGYGYWHEGCRESPPGHEMTWREV